MKRLWKHKVVGIAVLAICCFFPPSSYAADAEVAEAVAANCRAYFAANPDWTALSADRVALFTIKQCIDMGFDPPLRSRDNKGSSSRNNASSATGVLPTLTCPPFAPCFYVVRANNSPRTVLNSITSGQSFNQFSGGSTFDAPQFPPGPPLDPSNLPSHLVNGSTIYFYGRVCFTPPDTAFLVPNHGMHTYADGSQICMDTGHVMLPPSPGCEIVNNTVFITLGQDAKLNFDDSGIIILPTGFQGVIGGRAVRGGQPIHIAHRRDIFLPRGTRIYPIPNISQPADIGGDHSPPIAYPPYDGCQIVLPPSPPMLTFTSGPPDTRWW